MKLLPMPKEKVFFELFNRQADDLMNAVRLLREVVLDFKNLETYAEKFSELEHEADITAHEIIDRLNRTFITPLDREDIYALAHGIDEIVDLAEAAVGKARLYRIPAPNEAMLHFVEIIYKSAQEIEKAVKMLESLKNSRRLLDHCIEINRLENEGDTTLRTAMEDLIKNHVDTFELIRWKEIYESLEAAIDKCEDVANILENIIVKGV